MDETFVRIAGKWMYLFRAVDGHGQTVDFYLSETGDRMAAKLFLQQALTNPDNQPPHVFARDGLRGYPAAIREFQMGGKVAHGGPPMPSADPPYCNNRIESDHRHIKRRLRAMQGARTASTTWAAIQGIEAAQILRRDRCSGSRGAICTGRLGCSGRCSDSTRSCASNLGTDCASVPKQHFRPKARWRPSWHRSWHH
jgi:transposase, IS6 family